MAVEKIVIEVSGKDDLSSTIKDVEKLGAADAANAAIFKKTNQEFQAGLKNTNKAVAATVDGLKGLVPVVTAAFAVEKVVAFGKESVLAFLKSEDAGKRLLNALKNNTGAFERLSKSAEDYQKTTVFGKGLITDAQTFLAVQGRTEAQINKVIAAAVQLSTVTGKDLQTSVQELNATYSGTLTSIGRLDPEFKKLTSAQLANGEAIDLVAEKYAGLAENELKTTSGGLKKLHNIFEDLQETIGEGIVAAGQGLIGTLDVLTLGAFNLTDANIGLADSEDDVKESFVKTRKEGELLAKQLVGGMIALKEFQLAQLNGGAGSDELRKSIEELKETIAEVPVVAKEYGETIADIEERISDLKDAQKSMIPGTQDLRDNIADIAKWENILKEALGKTTDKIKEQKKAIEDSGLAEYAANVRAGLEAGYKAEADALKQSAQDVADYEKELRDEARKEIKDQTNFEIAEAERAAREKIEIADEEARKQEQIREALLQAAMQITSMYFDAVARQNQADTDNVLNQLQTQLDAREITQEQYNESRKRVLTQQANDNKANSIFEATIKGAVAVVEALGEGGPVLAAIAAALVLAEIATIAAAPVPQFEKGGRIKGKRHREGGTVIEAEEGEFVINRKAAKKIGFDNLEVLNRGALPPKLLKQGLTEQRNKVFETSMMKVFGSADFDTYPIEKELRKSRKNDTQIAQMLIKQLGRTKQKRGY